MKNVLGCMTLVICAGACAVAEDFEDRSVPTSDSAADVGVVRQGLIEEDVFKCSSTDRTTQLLCQTVLARVNAELDASNITIDRQGVLFQYDDPTDQSIPTGHSCSVTAEVKRRQATARLGANASLDLSGNSLKDPLVIKLSLPVAVDVKVDVRQRFGSRITFGNCSHYGSDSYSLNADLSTTADIAVALALNPALATTDRGDYVIILKPTLAAASRLRNTELDFHVSGVSPITPILTFVAGFSSTLMSSLRKLHDGDSVSDIFKETAAWDLGMPIILGAGVVSDSLERRLFELLDNGPTRDLQKRAQQFGADLEQNLTAKLARALRLDERGERVVVVKREFVELFDALGAGADVFISPPVDPSVACFAGLMNLCNACRGCQECIAESRRCQDLHVAYLASNPLQIIRPVPPVVTPTPGPEPQPDPLAAQRQACLDQATRDCNACRGCSSCVSMFASCSTRFPQP